MKRQGLLAYDIFTQRGGGERGSWNESLDDAMQSGGGWQDVSAGSSGIVGILVVSSPCLMSCELTRNL